MRALREKEALEHQVAALEQESSRVQRDWGIAKQSLIDRLADLEAQLSTDRLELASKTQQNISLQVCECVYE